MNSAAVSASVDTHKFFHVGEQPSSLSSWHAGRVHHRYRMLNPASSIVERLLVPQCPTAFKKYLGSSNLISKFNLLILLAHWAIGEVRTWFHRSSALESSGAHVAQGLCRQAPAVGRLCECLRQSAGRADRERGVCCHGS